MKDHLRISYFFYALWFYCSQRFLKYLTFQSFGYERWRIIQKLICALILISTCLLVRKTVSLFHKRWTSCKKPTPKNPRIISLYKTYYTSFFVRNINYMGLLWRHAMAYAYWYKLSYGCQCSLKRLLDHWNTWHRAILSILTNNRIQIRHLWGLQMYFDGSSRSNICY